MSDNDRELKSAFDIALERASKLGGISSDEKQKLQEEKLASIGIALSKRYTSGLPIRDVETELEKYREDRRAIVGYLVASLMDKLDMKDPDGAEPILEAARHFSGKPKVVENIRALLGEYQKAMEKAWQGSQSKLGAVKRKEMKAKGISGSAVEPAIETSTEWLQIKQQLDSTYKKRLQEIKTPLQAL